jgi:hypothetical protein
VKMNVNKNRSHSHEKRGSYSALKSVNCAQLGLDSFSTGEVFLNFFFLSDDSQKKVYQKPSQWVVSRFKKNQRHKQGRAQDHSVILKTSFGSSMEKKDESSTLF